MPGFGSGGAGRARGLAADLPGRCRHRAARRGKYYGALWKVSQRDLEQLDRYEGYPSLYGRELLSVQLGGDELSAITYVMRDRDSYRGLPSPSYLETIRQGYEEWGLPKLALELAVARVRERLFDLGIRHFEPDGPKRLRPAQNS